MRAEDKAREQPRSESVKLSHQIGELEDAESQLKTQASDLVKANGRLRREITERKRIEETLKESEAKLKAMLESLGDHMSMMDKELNIIWANKTAKQVFGEDIIGKKCYEAYHRREKPCEPYPCLTLKVFADGEIHKHNTQVIDKEGKTRYFHCTASAALKDKDGKPAAVIEISRDITECRQAVEERIRLATAVEQAAESVIISDRQGTIQYVNPAFELLSGFTREDIVGKNFRVLKSDKHDESFYRKMWETITKGEAWAGRISNRMKDGSLREFETTISPIRDNTGAIVNFVSVNRDVTQEVALEAQLLHAQKMEAVGTLAGGIAHDFNNLLQVIRGYTEVLLNALNKDHSGYEQLQKIHRSAKRGAELTRQLLTFSRKVQSERRPLDLNQEVKLVKNLLKRTIPKMIEIELHLNEAPAIVSADPIQVEQALMNLAVNAMDAMPEGGKLVMETEKVILDERFCKTHLGAKPGEYILLSISDTGHGMNREMLEHVFEPFYTTKEVGKGTGLGLAMVYGIVKNHEGYILCYSEPNTGTTFKIYLPALEQDGHWRKMSDREHYIRGGNETILLVDDEDYIRELGTELLTDAGYKVITATDGENGLEIYRKQLQRIDLVILDLVIPGMGGKRCYEEILKINPRAKILIVSGYSADGPGKEALEAGARGFVGKPFDVSHMLDTVREILDQD